MVHEAIVALLNEAAKYPRLTRAQEGELVKQAHADIDANKLPSAFERILLNNAKVIWACCKKNAHRLPPEDAFQYCVIAMRERLRDYDPSRNATVATWLQWILRDVIQRAEAKYGGAIQISVGSARQGYLEAPEQYLEENCFGEREIAFEDWSPKGDLLAKIDQLPVQQRKILLAIYAEEKGPKEIALELGISYQRVTHLRDVAILSLDDLANPWVRDTLNPIGLTPNRDLLALMACLTEHQRQIILGIYAEEKQPKAIALELGMSYQRVTYMRDEAIALMEGGGRDRRSRIGQIHQRLIRCKDDLIAQKDVLKLDIHSLVGRLPEPQRSLINWLYFEQISPLEVGQRIGISYQKVIRLRDQALGELNTICIDSNVVVLPVPQESPLAA